MSVRRRRFALRTGAAIGALAGLGALRLGSGVAPRPARVLALGDSYTIGTRVSPADRWVNGLARRLRASGHDLHEPAVVAASGWTSTRLLGEIESVTTAADRDLVTLLVGANDAFQGRSPGAFGATLRELVDRAIGFAGDDPARVVLLTVPDYTLTPVGRENDPEEHAARLAAYNESIRSVAASSALRLVDLVPPSRLVADRPELVARDGLHPSPEQHDLWLERILPVALDVLRRP